MPTHPASVDQYLQIGCGRCDRGSTADCNVLQWAELLLPLRRLLISSGLREEIKWMQPCYTLAGKNVALLAAQKRCVVLSFFQGEQLPDPDGLLTRAGPNARYGKVMRLTNLAEMTALESTICGFIEAAKSLSRSAKKPESVLQSNDELLIPAELKEIFLHDAAYQAAFDALTPGRKRGYLLHFNAAKQSATRTRRIEKCKAKIFAGKGWGEY